MESTIKNQSVEATKIESANKEKPDSEEKEAELSRSVMDLLLKTASSEVSLATIIGKSFSTLIGCRIRPG